MKKDDKVRTAKFTLRLRHEIKQADGKILFFPKLIEQKLSR